MSPLRLCLLSSLTMVAFAANSLLCRLALATEAIDAMSFTLIRICSGAICLALLLKVRRNRSDVGGSWLGAFMLFGYSAAFSLAYLELSTGTGALLLFGAVQVTMIAYGLLRGERLSRGQCLGSFIAIGGLIYLLSPGLTAPAPLAASLMLGSGLCWGVYSLLGRGVAEPLPMSAGNFLRAIPMALAAFAALFIWQQPVFLPQGIAYAIASGTLASGLGYALWYGILPNLRATTAATMQLSVPVIAAIAGVMVLGEVLSWRLGISSLAVLGGIAAVLKLGKKG